MSLNQEYQYVKQKHFSFMVKALSSHHFHHVFGSLFSRTIFKSDIFWAVKGKDRQVCLVFISDIEKFICVIYAVI